MMTILSILIPSIPEREQKLAVLLAKVQRQVFDLRRMHPTLGGVEILSDDSKPFLEGGLSIGKKRESLVKRAQGTYLCFLDDDDDIAPNYVETLVRLCYREADVITFRNISKLSNFWMTVDMRLNYPNDEASPEFQIRRKPWHICPVRSSYARLHDFPDSNYSEDWQWMASVLQHCTTEAHTDAILHEYRHGGHSESDKIIKAGYA